MNQHAVIQHSDRVQFKKMLEERLCTGWELVSICAAPMKSEDWYCAVLRERDREETMRLAEIAKIVLGKKRANLTNAEFETIRRLAGAQDV